MGQPSLLSQQTNMKNRHQQRQLEQGSVWLSQLVICAILSILMGSYLHMIQTQRFPWRILLWNQARGQEAGVEGHALLNSEVKAPNLQSSMDYAAAGFQIAHQSNHISGTVITKWSSPTNLQHPPHDPSKGRVPGPIVALLLHTIAVDETESTFPVSRR
jgi:hypothetical protein